ncbi:hypothetical protein ACFY6U_07420 [Streptomyces sp. NPDC013157]|uniref:hypothetical protein n=1 Tax=Streptomyces sp. NPDC013157 TaxID=3364861 RepID=UPI0036A44060
MQVGLIDAADLRRDPSGAVPGGEAMGVFPWVFNVTGLPVRVRLVAAPWREDLPLQVSRSPELALPWHGRRPPLG